MSNIGPGNCSDPLWWHLPGWLHSFGTEPCSGKKHEHFLRAGLRHPVSLFPFMATHTLVYQGHWASRALAGHAVRASVRLYPNLLMVSLGLGLGPGPYLQPGDSLIVSHTHTTGKGLICPPPPGDSVQLDHKKLEDSFPHKHVTNPLPQTLSCWTRKWRERPFGLVSSPVLRWPRWRCTWTG